MLELKIACAVGILEKLKSLSKKAMLNLYYFVLHTHLVYSITVLDSTFPSNIERLHLQNSYSNNHRYLE